MRRLLPRTVLGLTVAAAMAVFGWTVPAVAIAVVVVARVALELVAPRAGAAVDRALARVGDAVGCALAAVAFGALHLVVILPAWAVTTPWRRRRAQRREPGWSAPPVAEAHALRPFSAPAQPRRGWWIGPAITAGLVVALAVVVVRREQPEQLPAALRDQPGIDALTDAEADILVAVQADAALGWRLPPDAGHDGMTTDADGLRTTTGGATDGPVVWVFGGSTAFGTGQRDDRTIASQMAMLLADTEGPVTVRNFGVHAYTSMQEVDAFAAALAAAPEPPDVAVFYDGSNDMAVGLGAELLGGTAGEPIRAPFQAGEVALDPGPPRPLSPSDQRVEGVVAAYAEAVERARALGAEHGVAVVHVWQPVAYTRDLTDGEVDALEAKGIDALQRTVYARLFAEARTQLPQGVHDLGDVLDDAPTVYADEVHTNEEGASLVAAALAPIVADALADR